MLITPMYIYIESSSHYYFIPLASFLLLLTSVMQSEAIKTQRSERIMIANCHDKFQG